MKNIVSLTKTFSGNEFIKPMTLSIYEMVNHLVFINSETSWTGAKGNTCKQAIYEMQKSGMDKIISVDYNTTNQMSQCGFGYDYIKARFPDTSHIMLIDTDEIFDSLDLERAIKFVNDNPNHMAYRCNLYTYIKHPLYRLDPIEELQPVVFVNALAPDLGTNFRACDMKYVVMPDVFLHHFVHVRKNFNTVLEKIITSHVSENEQYQDMSRWIPEVWCKLPNIEGEWAEKGFHPNVKYRKNWRGIRQIGESELPKVLREHSFPIMEQFGIGKAKRYSDEKLDELVEMVRKA